MKKPLIRIESAIFSGCGCVYVTFGFPIYFVLKLGALNVADGRFEKIHAHKSR